MTSPLSSGQRQLIDDLLSRSHLGQANTITDAGGGRGVFSTVCRISLESPEVSAASQPRTVIAKLPIDGPNGQAARVSGAYQRERLAYQEFLTTDTPAHPRCYASASDNDGGVAFLLEDVGALRAVDQLAGLNIDDTGAVVDQLAGLHARFGDTTLLEGFDVRRSAPAAFAPEALGRGIEALTNRVGSETGEVFVSLLENRPALLAAFDELQGQTLCHGDPRADNLVFDPRGGAVLFDWQQLAVQIGEADIAWLLATSLSSNERPAAEDLVVARYANSTGRSLDETLHRYRLGMLLPGLAVLLLAQRETNDERTTSMVATSVQRIAAAIVELDVANAAC